MKKKPISLGGATVVMATGNDWQLGISKSWRSLKPTYTSSFLDPVYLGFSHIARFPFASRNITFIPSHVFSLHTQSYIQAFCTLQTPQWWAVLLCESLLHPAASVAALVSHTVWFTHSYRPNSPRNPHCCHLWALTALTPLHQAVRSKFTEATSITAKGQIVG